MSESIVNSLTHIIEHAARLCRRIGKIHCIRDAYAVVQPCCMAIVADENFEYGFFSELWREA